MSITLLKTKGDLNLTKTIYGLDDKSLIKPYDNAKTFTWCVEEIRDIEDLSNILEGLRNEPQMCVIHGRPNHTNVETTRKTKEGDIEDAMTDWVMFDFDGILLPYRDESITAVSETFVKYLPEQFHNVSYYSSFSSSAGVSPSDWSRASVHLWMMLSAPILSSDLFKWGKAFAHHNISTHGSKVIDHSVLNIVQPNYTADPIFVGIADPVKTRSTLVIKNSQAVALPEYTIPEVKYIQSDSVYVYEDFNQRLETKLNSIGCGDMFYYPMHGAFLWYINSCHGRGCDPNKEWIIGKVRERLALGRPQYIEHLSDEYDKAYNKAYPKKSAGEIEAFRLSKEIAKRQQGMLQLRNRVIKLKGMA